MCVCVCVWGGGGGGGGGGEASLLFSSYCLRVARSFERYDRYNFLETKLCNVPLQQSQQNLDVTIYFKRQDQWGFKPT